jgi:predicted unusual protein kinase regulating ubiquinone biosynthesis (AarF/ABC1/UbiB family)
MVQVMSSYMKAGDEAGQRPVNLGAMMGEVLMLLQRHNVSLRGDVAMTIVTMSISEGLIRQLDPTFDIVRNAIPYFVRFRSWGTSSLRCNCP